MILEVRPLWLAQTNTYIVAPEKGGPALVIDAPPAVDAIGSVLAENELRPVALLITHGHVDHVGGAGSFQRAHGATAYVHPADDFLTLHPAEQLRMLFGVVPAGDFAPPAVRSDLRHGEVLTPAGLELEVRHTPGHTPGHCCFYLASEGILFSGDQLFAGSIGRTDLPGGDFDTLMRSMDERILDLPDETIVYPGHGPATTLARERRLNPFLQGDIT